MCDLTAEHSSRCLRSWTARASDPGAGGGWAGYSGSGLSGSFSFSRAVGLWPRRGVARPCRLWVSVPFLIPGGGGAADPRPDPGRISGAFPVAILPPIPGRGVWRIGHGEGEVLGGWSGVTVRYRGKSKARRLRRRVEYELAREKRIP